MLFKNIFENSIKGVLHCGLCQHKNISAEVFVDFNIPVKENFFDCLAEYLSVQYLDEYICQNCNEAEITLQYQQFTQLNDVFVLALSRFSFD